MNTAKNAENKFKGAIFDLDGTIAYTLEDLKTAMNLMLADFGYPLQGLDGILAAINCGAHEFVRGCLPENVRDDDGKVDECHKVYSGYYSEHYNDTTYLYDGILETVLEMKKRGMKLAVLSNKGDEHTKAIVYKLFPEGTFDYVFGNRPDFPTKPDPKSALFVTANLGLTSSDILYIGDSNVDMETAGNAGFYPCGVTWGYRDRQILLETGAKTLVDEPRQLLDLI